MFIPSRWLLLLIAFLSIVLIGFAVYLQHYQNMLPCPYCVILRYAFLGLALFALIGALAAIPKIAAGLGLLTALSGIGAAAHLVYVQAHPTVSCGIDPVETMLNTIFTARWLPWLFQTNGECTTPYPPVFGLSVPQGALLWMVIFSLAFGFILLRRRHQ